MEKKMHERAQMIADALRCCALLDAQGRTCGECPKNEPCESCSSLLEEAAATIEVLLHDRNEVKVLKLEDVERILGYWRDVREREPRDNSVMRFDRGVVGLFVNILVSLCTSLWFLHMLGVF